MSTHNKIEFRGSFSQIMAAIRTGPELMRLSIDVPLSERQNAMGLHALIDQPLRITVQVDNAPASTRITRPSENGKPKREKPKKEPKGPFSEFWRLMVIKDIKTYPDLQDFLGCPIEDVWASLHEFFGVETMATVSPMEWDAFVTKHHLNTGLLDISRHAALEASVSMERKRRAEAATGSSK